MIEEDGYVRPVAGDVFDLFIVEERIEFSLAEEISVEVVDECLDPFRRDLFVEGGDRFDEKVPVHACFVTFAGRIVDEGGT